MENLEKRYFDWLISKVNSFVNETRYSKLLNHLYNRSFNVYILPMDQNRSEDGINLRYSGFGYECHIDQHEIERYLDRRDCSMLEMMVSLSIKAENIVGDSEIGDRTGLWFWSMLESLGLTIYDDMHYEMEAVEFAIDCFLNHDYKPNGKGGLFTVKDPPHDMRNTEIWNQMCWFLSENELYFGGCCEL